MNVTRKNNVRVGFVAAAVVALIVGLASNASASKLALDDPNTLGLDFVFDGVDLDGLVDTGAFISVGDFPVNFSAGLASLLGARLDLASLNGSFLPNASINVLFTQTGFSTVGNAYADISGSTDGALQYAAFWDPGNTEFGLTNLIGAPLFFGPASEPGQAFSGSTSQVGVGNSAYSLTQVVTIYHAGGNVDVSSFNANVRVAAVPEPASIMLLGLGSVAAIVARRRLASG